MGQCGSSWETDRKNDFHKRLFSLRSPYVIWLGLLSRMLSNHEIIDLLQHQSGYFG